MKRGHEVREPRTNREVAWNAGAPPALSSLLLSISGPKWPATAALALELPKYLDRGFTDAELEIQQEPKDQWAAVLTHLMGWPRRQGAGADRCLPAHELVLFPCASSKYMNFLFLGTAMTQEKLGNIILPKQPDTVHTLTDWENKERKYKLPISTLREGTRRFYRHL